MGPRQRELELCDPADDRVRGSVARATAAAIRAADDAALVTIGLHMEDLEENRRLGPREAADSCDFLSMHGYPIYASWAEARSTRTCSRSSRASPAGSAGKHVLFSEFGLPTAPRGGTPRRPSLVDEDAAAVYTASALEALRDAGCLGAMLWCYSDYDRARWSSPPLDLARHERSFGLWRADGSPKPAVAAVAAFAGVDRCDADGDDGWIDIGRDEFLLDPGRQLPRLYGRYRGRSRGESAPAGRGLLISSSSTYAKPSCGLEPQTPSLPYTCARN